MGYVKKAYRELLEQIDYMNYLPNKWNEFVSKQEEKQNLLIKKEMNVFAPIASTFLN